MNYDHNQKTDNRGLKATGRPPKKPEPMSKEDICEALNGNIEDGICIFQRTEQLAGGETDTRVWEVPLEHLTEKHLKQ